MYLCRKHTEETQEAIGMEFGKHHSTVIFAYEKIEKERNKDKTISDALDKLEKEIHN